MTEPAAIVSVYAVFGDAGEAERIGRAMVEQRRAACVNILGACRSIYRWAGKIEESDEVAAIFKTTAGKAAQLIEEIARLHSYDVPAVVAWPVSEVPDAYQDWVIGST